jgi:hypothetical protein
MYFLGAGMTKGTLNKLLLVDDDEDIQEIAKLSLESIGGFYGLD